MNDAKKQKLKQLLNAALANIEIQCDEDEQPREQDQPSPMSVDDYKVQLQKSWKHPYALDSLEITSLSPQVIDETARLALLNFMQEELKEFIHEDHILSASDSLLVHRPQGYHIDMFMEHLIDISICYGIDEAVLSFERSTKTHISFQFMALLEGIKLDEKIEVCEGIKLMPLSYEKSDLPPYLPVMNLSMPGFDISASFSGKTLLVIDASVSPIFHKPLSDKGKYPFRVQIKGEKLQKLNIRQFVEKFCHSLSLVCNTPVQISLEWERLSPREFSNPIYNSLPILYGLRNIPNIATNTKKLGETEVKEAIHLHEVMAESDVVEKLRVPLDRWIASKTQKNDTDKVIDLGIALETIYLSGIDSELSFRLALHVARYLGENKKERKELFEELKAFYKCRSKVVHRGIPPYEVKVGEQSIRLHELIKKVQYLCKKSILKIIKEGKFPDWDDLIHS